MIVKKRIIIALIFAQFFITGTCLAKHWRPELENVPIERLIKNLTNKYESDPGNNQVLFALARTYGMAFVSQRTEVEVVKDIYSPQLRQEGPWFGFEPHNVPYAVLLDKATKNNQSSSSNSDYLNKAIELHKKALDKDSDNPLIRIGLAWCLEQSGKINEAIKEYRNVIQRAWPNEEGQKDVMSGQLFITEEASQYLVPLLDPEKDKNEILKLKRYQQHFDRLPRAITPIVIPLIGDPALGNIIDKENQPFFDLDGSGIPKSWEWIKPNAAFLVFDKHGSGEITSALKMFGNVTFWLFWKNGYEALQALDDNRDGQLTGHELDGLALWQDINQNGISEKGEVRSLAAWGIVRLRCNYQFKEDGTPYSSSGVLFTTGDIKPSYDVYLKRKVSPATLRETIRTMVNKVVFSVARLARAEPGYFFNRSK